jgi:hypothetical protein
VTPVHDFLHILGLPAGADADDIRRAARRRPRRLHPDFGETSDGRLTAPPADETAVDFVEMWPIVDRMQAAFFGDPS